MKSYFHIKVWAARLTLRKIEAKSNTEMGYCPGLEPRPLDSDFSIADQEDHSAPESGPTAENSVRRFDQLSWKPVLTARGFSYNLLLYTKTNFLPRNARYHAGIGCLKSAWSNKIPPNVLLGLDALLIGLLQTFLSRAIKIQSDTCAKVLYLHIEPW